LENDYAKVKQDFATIADYINKNSDGIHDFHFNLSHTIKLLETDKNLLSIIEETCFGSIIRMIIRFIRLTYK